MDKMKIFIGWSGDLSRAVGTHLRDWIPDVIRNAETWLSSEDLRKGLQWLPELNKKLADSTVGIMVLTRENLDASWILFEAGTLSKALPDKHCCTLLCDLKPTDVSGPLAQFQATSLNGKDMLRLMKTINAASGDAKIDEPRLERWFQKFWPQFEESCQKELARSHAERGESAPVATERDLLEEILGTIRRMGTSYLPNSFEGIMQAIGQIARRPTPGSFSEHYAYSDRMIVPPEIVLEHFKSLPPGVQEEFLNLLVERRSTHLKQEEDRMRKRERERQEVRRAKAEAYEDDTGIPEVPEEREE